MVLATLLGFHNWAGDGLIRYFYTATHSLVDIPTHSANFFPTHCIGMCTKNLVR